MPATEITNASPPKRRTTVDDVRALRCDCHHAGRCHQGTDSEMLQRLLEERFRVATHRETRQADVYHLVVGKSGMKAKECKPDDCPVDQLFHQPTTGRHRIQVSTLTALANMLSGVIRRQVLDKTNVLGKFNLVLEDFAGTDEPPRSELGRPDEVPSAGRSVFSAIQDLGLKLEPGRAEIEYLIVDKADKIPTETRDVLHNPRLQWCGFRRRRTPFRRNAERYSGLKTNTKGAVATLAL